MKQKLKAASSLLLIAVMAMTVSLTGCKKVTPHEVISEPSSTASNTSSAPVSEPEQKQEGNLNPFTGLYDLPDEMVNRRPITCMINNSHKAWPQKSISSADIIYELPVEGGSTRLMAVYGDYTKADTFGSVRSARHDFVELSKPLDAIFIHWGGSTFGYDAIKNNGINDIDGMVYGTKYFYTDKTLNRSVEHCRFMEVEQLTQAIDGLKLETKGTPKPAYRFNTTGTPVTYPEPATNVTVPFSGELTVKYNYNAEKKTYQKMEYNDLTLDGNTNQPVEISNVFLLFAQVNVMADGEHKDIVLTSGDGFYLTNGTKTAIKWTKGQPSDPIRYTLASGEELTVNPGNSWVLFSPTSVQGKVTFTDAQ